MESKRRERRRLVLLMVAFEGSLVGLAWALGWLLGQRPLEHLSWSLQNALWGVVASLPLLLAFVLMLRFPVGPLARVKELCDEAIRPWFVSCTLFDLAGISVLAGVGEEMLFRGVLQPVFGRGLGTWPALFVTSALFGLLHPISAAYTVIAGLFGVYLGCLWLATENLLVVMVAHAVYDFLVLAYLVARAPS
jgi:membrane protease YdiL (CAAX protease family)